MTRYQITLAGVDFGTYTAVSPMQALDQCLEARAEDVVEDGFFIRRGFERDFRLDCEITEVDNEP